MTDMLCGTCRYYVNGVCGSTESDYVGKEMHPRDWCDAWAAAANELEGEV